MSGAGTRPTAGVPFHPTEGGTAKVTRVVFETTAQPNSEPVSKYAADLLARTVGHLERVDVGGLLTAYLGEHMPDVDPDDSPHFVAEEILNLTALIESVLDQARAHLRVGLSIDLTTTLIPRLKGTRS